MPIGEDALAVFQPLQGSIRDHAVAHSNVEQPVAVGEDDALQRPVAHHARGSDVTSSSVASCCKDPSYDLTELCGNFFREVQIGGYEKPEEWPVVGPGLLTQPFHVRPFFGLRQPWAAYVLALFVVVAQPVTSLAWLGGAHATPEQAALHETAVEHGYADHHGGLGHHAHEDPRRDAETDAHFPPSTLGSEFASAAPHAGPFQDLLQTLIQAMLAMPPDAPSPGEAPRGASLAEDLPSQHSPPVPHRPPTLLLTTVDVL